MLIKQVFAVFKEYFFKSEKKFFATSLFILLIGFELFTVFLEVQFNHWNNDFYNSIQEVNRSKFFAAMGKFSFLAGIFILTFVTKLFINLSLQLSWRSWMTKKYLDLWGNNLAFYGTKVIGKETDNPDQRIAQDVSSFIELSIGLTLGLLNAVTTFISFVVILWSLSGVVKIELFGSAFNIYGSLVWAALIYAFSATIITRIIGKPLSTLLFQQEKKEADFRFSMMRVREHAESIALYDAMAYEKEDLLGKFGSIVTNTKSIIKNKIALSTFNSFYHQLAIIFPFLIVSPRFFAGEILLGGLMQIASAFGQVQTSLSWIIDSYANIANMKAVAERLDGFNASIKNWGEARAEAKQLFSQNKGNALTLSDLEISLPDKKVILQCKDITFSKKSYLITGISGSGKSTLFRAIAGIWPFVKGEMSLPANLKVMFIPQKNYMPNGKLIDALCYPGIDIASIDIIPSLLKDTGLDEFIDRLEEVNEWGRVLSLGEQQKVAIIRAILNEPGLLFLDEATSSMDDESEKQAYSMLKQYLPKTMVISIGHRSSMKDYHDEVLSIQDNMLQSNKRKKSG